MPNINTMKESKFLKKEDVGPGRLLTIRDVIQENVAKKDEAPELKWCLTFDETDLPMVANQTNLQIIAQFLNSPETGDWVGKKIVAFNDTTIMFGGKITGGIRVRAPRPQQPSKPVFQQTASRPPVSAPVNPPPMEAGPVAQEFDERGNPIDPDVSF